MATTQADDPNGPPNVHAVQASLTLPHRYHVLVQPADDPEGKEWFVSDGIHQWQAEQFFEGDEISVHKKPFDNSGWGVHRIDKFLQLDSDKLSADFSVRAQSLDPQAVNGAVAAVYLTARSRDLADLAESITVLVDEAYRTKSVTIIDGRGNRRLIEVLAADYHTPPAADMFVWPE